MLEIASQRELDLAGEPAPGRPAAIAAASGLVRTETAFYVIADDELALGVFDLEGDAPGRLLPVLPGELPAPSRERKASKPDLEALARLPSFPGCPDGALLLLGSGSTPARNRGVLHALDSAGGLAGEPRALDLTAVYEVLAKQVPDLNIEGAAVAGERLCLMQRGNGRAGCNALIELDLRDSLAALADRGGLDGAALRAIHPHDLGEVNGAPLCFSDAAMLPGDRLLFTAVAEKRADTYHDGPCEGSAVGILAADGSLELLRALSSPVKVEGIEGLSEAAGTRLWMVADADDPSSPSPLLTATLA